MEKAQVKYDNPSTATIYMPDGGVTTFHYNQEYMLTTYYQSRIDQFAIDDDDMWEKLGDGKTYCKEWKDKHVIDDEMIEDAINWLGYGLEEVRIVKFK